MKGSRVAYRIIITSYYNTQKKDASSIQNLSSGIISRCFKYVHLNRVTLVGILGAKGTQYLEHITIERAGLTAWLHVGHQRKKCHYCSSTPCLLHQCYQGRLALLLLLWEPNIALVDVFTFNMKYGCTSWKLWPKPSMIILKYCVI